MKFEYTIDQIRLLVQAVTQEYRTRFYIKMDSLVELSKFIKKFYMLTGEIQYKLTDDIFHAFFTDNVCRLVDSICKKREFVVMQYYINEK